MVFPEDVKVIINAGVANSAWSGGDYWKEAGVIEALTAFVHNGGGSAWRKMIRLLYGQMEASSS